MERRDTCSYHRPRSYTQTTCAAVISLMHIPLKLEENIMPSKLSIWTKLCTIQRRHSRHYENRTYSRISADGEICILLCASGRTEIPYKSHRYDWTFSSRTKVTALKTHQSEARKQLNNSVTSDALDESHVRFFRLQVVKKLLEVTIKSVGYDARARTLLRRLVLTMNLQWADVTQEDEKIGQTLYAEATATLLAKKEAMEPKGWDWKHHAAIGAATVTGGALLALIGGLAAPAIAASLTVLGGAGVTIGAVVGSATGVTATTVLFGTAGAGVMGMKTEKGTKSVHDVGFDLVSA
uniref:Uncharacterized protein n=1 Tax=Hyaloperonospora arabidopsidis (strain Emoy2) TaxID=559515 RepID=M4B213_HYAAE